MELRSLLLSRDEEMIEVLRWALEDIGIAPELYSVVPEARSRAETHKFDAILVDCDVPGGIEFLENTLEMSANALTVTFAIVDSDLGIPAALQRGANLAIQKPVTLDAARSLLRAAYGMIMEERRSHTRYPVDVPVKIVANSAAIIHGVMLNASVGGIAFESEAALALDSSVNLSFHLPGMKDAMEVLAVVVWSGPSGKAGVRFEALSATMRQRLEEWLLTQAASLTS